MHPPKSSKVWLFQISSKNYEPSSLNLYTNTCGCLWLPIYSTFSKGTGLAKGLIIWDWSVFWKFKVINCSQKCALPSLRRFWSFRYFIFHLKTMKHNRKRTFTSCFKSPVWIFETLKNVPKLTFKNRGLWKCFLTMIQKMEMQFLEKVVSF